MTQFFECRISYASSRFISSFSCFDAGQIVQVFNLLHLFLIAFEKDICLYIAKAMPSSGSSNDRIRSWFASLSRSILIRFRFALTIYPYSFGSAAPSLLENEILLDMFGKSIVDLSVSRDRLLLTGSRIDVHVVISTVTMQSATCFRELADQFGSFHTTISLVR